MNHTRKRAAGLLPAALLAAACIALAPAPAACAIDYHWIGAGTGGNTATDPADPSTQWNNPDNWQEGQIPGPADNPYLPLGNAGYVNLPCGAISGFILNGTSQEGAVHIGEGVPCSTNYGAGTYSGQGRVIQDGGDLTINGGMLILGWLGSGSYLLSSGTLTVGGRDDEIIGHYGTGVFTQTGGTHIVNNALYVGSGDKSTSGTLNLGGGTLRAGTLYVGQSGASGILNITSDAASVTVENVTFGSLASLHTIPNGAIHVSGEWYPGFYIYLQDESAFVDLENLALIFDGATPLRRGRLEVAGRDLGPTASGFVDNFALGSLFVGATDPALLWLFDDFDNGNRSSAEALYVHDIMIGPGSTLDLRGFNLYYDGLYDNQGTVLGGTPVFVPEPGSVMLLALGLGIVRCLRFFSRAGA
jgi:hypothetical protein